jgi:hypothetical protein
MLRKDAADIKATSLFAKSVNTPVLTISSLGRLGRFGNQIFQYAFLRICAAKSGAHVECPPEAIEKGLKDVDLWGFFEFPSHLLRPHQEYFRSLFQPVPELADPLREALTTMRSKAKTIVGIHIRRLPLFLSGLVREPGAIAGNAGEGFHLLFAARAEEMPEPALED